MSALAEALVAAREQFWAERDRKPFRCGRCGKMVWDGDGRWAVRGAYTHEQFWGSNQFMAVHRVSCNSFRRWLGR